MYIVESVKKKRFEKRTTYTGKLLCNLGVQGQPAVLVLPTNRSMPTH